MPFTITEFFDAFRHYNDAVWPAQLALIMLGVAALAFAAFSTPRASAATSAILAALWVWAGIAYHVALIAVVITLARNRGSASRGITQRV